METNNAVVGRLAPSPTGALHLGNARTFLLAWLSARSRGGRVLFRIEDLDHPKKKPGAAAGMLEDLRWLGLDWDGEPLVQSSRLAVYRGALDRLVAAGRAYPCVCTRRDVEQTQSAPHGRDPHTLAYSGRCRGRFASWEDACAALPDGRLPAWRFRAEPGPSAFDDLFLGRRELDRSEIGDFAFARDPDGAGYLLACAVDDALSGVTEVVRGADLVDAAHCQIQILEALGLPVPAFCHVPLVVAEDGRRLAKRHGDTRLASLRAAGMPPERVVGLLAWWSGLAPYGAECRPADLLPGFSLGRVPRAPAVLDARARALLPNGLARGTDVW